MTLYDSFLLFFLIDYSYIPFISLWFFFSCLVLWFTPKSSRKYKLWLIVIINIITLILFPSYFWYSFSKEITWNDDYITIDTWEWFLKERGSKLSYDDVVLLNQNKD